MQGGSPTQNDNAPNIRETARQRQDAIQARNEAVMHLTPEEEKIMNEMRRQTFFTHTIPAGMGCMLGVQVLMRKGIISPKNVFFKILGAGIFGFATSKFFAARHTMEKIIKEVPDGNLAKLWEARQAGLTGQAMLDFINNMSREGRSEAVQNEVMEPKQPTLRETVPIQAGLDDRFRPKMDGLEPTAKKDEDVPKKVYSYSQLRQLAEHQEQQTMSRSSRSEDQSVRPRQAQEPKFFTEDEPAPPKRRVRRNQYGDEME